jgi:hypothetical protein
MSFAKIKTYIEERRDFYSTNPTESPPENMEEFLRERITDDIFRRFKVGSWIANRFYDDVLHPKSRYYVKLRVFVNSGRYEEFTDRPTFLLSSTYAHFTLKECYPSPQDCMECWRYWCSCCSRGSNSMYGVCDSTDCMFYMRKHLSKLIEGMNDDNKIGILLTVSSLRMTEYQAREYELGEIDIRDYGFEDGEYEFGSEELVRA